jgi:hypothetical protein
MADTLVKTAIYMLFDLSVSDRLDRATKRIKSPSWAL